MENYHWEAIEDLDICGAPYFTLIVANTTNLSQLVIPATFTSKTGWPDVPECTLVVSLSDPSFWPVQFLLPVKGDDDGSEGEAVSCGMGWTRFMRDMKVEFDDVLVLEVVDRSTLVVSKYHRSTQPCFVKTVMSSDRPDSKTGKMDIPTFYWKNIGEDKFEDRTYTLHGPMASVKVLSIVRRTKRQTWCYFADGFSAFYNANAVRVGDDLCFRKIEAWEFKVLKM